MNARILVVEDEALIADDLQTTLQRLGYDVPAPLATGREAIDAAAGLKPQLVLMDIKLQGTMDGIDAADVIHNEYGIPIVFLTSHSDEATLARAMAISPSGYLIKPFNDRELRTAVEVARHRHQLESQLAERERWFSTTLRSIGDAVIATDPGERITFMNAAAEAITGWRSVDAQGHPLTEVFRLVGPEGEPVQSPVGQALTQGFAVQLAADTSLLYRVGAKVAVDDSSAPIVDEKGNVLGGVVVFRDVTERNKLERRLAQSERLASLGTMAAGMGHEINNPLTAVMANLVFAADAIRKASNELSALQAPASASALNLLNDASGVLDEASDAAERVKRIVRRLSEFARVEKTPKALVDLPDALGAATRMAAHEIRHRARLVINYGTTPHVHASEGELVQLFTNLLVNAAQAIPDG